MDMRTAWPNACVIILVALTARIVEAQATPTAAAQSEARQEFLRLADAFDTAYRQKSNRLDVRAQQFLDPIGTAKRLLENGFVADQLDSLLSFEERNRGTHLGLMALRKIIRYSLRFGVPTAPVLHAKSTALSRLEHYVELPILAETLTYLAGSDRDGMNSYVDLEIGLTLRAIIKNDGAAENVVPAAKLKLYDWIMSFESFVKNREKLSQQLERARGNDDLESWHTVSYLEFALQRLPDKDEYAKWRQEAEKLLDDLIISETNCRMPVVKANDGNKYHIVRIDTEATKRRLTMSELALSRRVKTVGTIGQEIVCRLLDGQDWNLSKQKGHVVVVQFSFSGCAPCVRMYPVLKEIAEQHTENVRVLTILSDSDDATTRRTVKKYAIDWPVARDAQTDGVTEAWNITNFPTVLVFDRDGSVASIVAGDNDQLKKTVDKLLGLVHEESTGN